MGASDARDADTDQRARLGVLGPTHLVDRSGRTHPIRSAQQRRLLARLAYDADHVVTVDQLIDVVWSSEPPDTAKAALHVHISAIRKLLRTDAIGADGAIETVEPGYLLATSRLPVDVFERALAFEAALDDPVAADRSTLLAASEDTRRPFEELADFIEFLPTITRLDQLRESALDELLQVRLDRTAAPEHGVVAALEARHLDQPDRERPLCQLHLAYCRQGRLADAARLREAAPRSLRAQLERCESDWVPRRLDHQHPSPPLPRLAGRRVELERCADAIAGRSSVVVLAGEPGIGKTRLLRAVHEHAARHVEVVCPRVAVHPGVWPFVVAVDDAALLERVQRDEPTDDVSLRNALRDRLRSRAIGGVVTVDDLQWADEATMTMVEHLIDDLDRLPFGLVLALRSDRVDLHPRIDSLIGRVAQHPNGQMISLTTLDREASRRLLAATVPGPIDTDALIDRSDGVPLHLLELARLVGDRGEEAATAEVPLGIRAIVAARIEGLADDTLRILRTAAVLGGEVDVDLLAMVMSPEETRSSLDAIVEAVASGHRLGFIDRHGDVLTFRHEMYREVLADSLDNSSQLVVHDAAARHLGRAVRGGATELTGRWARHAEAAVPYGDRAHAVEALWAAGSTAARTSSWGDAADLYHRAIRQTRTSSPPIGGGDRLIELNIDYGSCLMRAGDRRAGLRQLRQSVDQARAAGSDLFPEAVRRLLEHVPPQALPRNDEGRQLLEEAIAVSDTMQNETRVQLLTDHANMVHLTAPLAERTTRSDRALRLAHSVGSARALGLAVTGKIGATWAPTTRSWRRRACRDAIDYAQRAGREADDTLAIALAAAMATALEFGRRDEFDRVRSRARELTPSLIQSPTSRWRLESWDPIALLLDSDLDAAQRRSDEVTRSVRHPCLGLATTSATQAVSIALLGDGLEGWRAVLDPFDETDAVTPRAALASLAASADGDDDGALELLDRYRAEILMPSDDATTTTGLALVAEAGWACGWRDGGAELVARLEPIADHHAVFNTYGGGGMYLGSLRAALARARALAGDPERARLDAQRALAAHRAMRCRLFVSRTEDLLHRLGAPT